MWWRRLPLSLRALPRKLSNLATGETIYLFLVHLLALLEGCDGLLLKLLLKFLFLWFGTVLLHHMCARTPLNDFLAFDIFCSTLVLNI
jgi:hypothetical protein